MIYDDKNSVIDYTSPQGVRTQVRPITNVLHGAPANYKQPFQSQVERQSAQVDILYVNFSSQPLMVQDRHGVALKIHPTNVGYQDGTLRIRRRMVLSGQTLTDFQVTLTHYNGLCSPELEVVGKACQDLGQRWPTSMMEVTFEWTIDAKRLQERAWYHYQSDMILYHPSHQGVFHPSCIHYANHQTATPVANRDYRTLAEVRVVYVNPEPGASTVWVNLAGQVMELAPQADHPTLYSRDKAGDYQAQPLVIVYHTAQGQEGSHAVLSRTIYTLEEAREKFGVYDNEYEAISLGDPRKRQGILSDTLREEIIHAQMEQERLRQELIAEQHAREKEREAMKAEQERVQRTIAQDRERYEIQKEQERQRYEAMKHQIDMDSARRKDQSEALKFVIGVTTALFSMVLLAFKLFTPSKSG